MSKIREIAAISSDLAGIGGLEASPNTHHLQGVSAANVDDIC
jgi:hypothetical protein